MKNHFAIVASALVMLCLFSSGCRKIGAKEQVQNELQKIYDADAAALVNRDIDGSLSHYAADYVGIDDKGHIGSLADERANTKTLLNDPISKMHFGTTIHSITLETAKGDKATVMATRHFSGVVPNLKSGQEVPIELESEIRAYWVKASTGWQLKREKEFASKAKLNGQPFTMK